MLDFSSLTAMQIGSSLLIGVLLGLVYSYVLWRSILYLPQVKNKGTFLFITGAVRIFLLMFIGVYFSFGSLALFMIIFISFFITRRFVVSRVKKNVIQTLDNNTIHNKGKKK